MSVAARRAAERWFLDRGLPSVLTPRARLRAVWPRSAPALAAFATLPACFLVIYWLTGETRIAIVGEPTPVEWIVLGIVAALPPLAALVGWLVARIGSNRTRAVVSTAAVILAVIGAALSADPVTLIITALIVVAILTLTASGIGSVLGWAVRLTLSHLAAVGSLMLRALPVVLLTVLVFFNSPVWLMSATIGRGRLWLALLFLGVIAAAFLISGTLDRATPVLDSVTEPPGAPARANTAPAGLAGTPFAAMPAPAPAPALTATERINVLFVLIASQLTQILIVVAVTAAIFFILGLILLSPEVLAAWTRNGSRDGTLLGMTIPVPQALIHITLFLGALTFMYVSARTVGGGEYGSQFLDPLIEDLRLTLVARNRYRAGVPAEPPVKTPATPHPPAASHPGVRLGTMPASLGPDVDVFGQRYGEVLLVRLGDSGPEATVYNSFPLNDCPPELWSKLDPAAIARDNDAQLALLNGPRYWLMSRIEKAPQGASVTKDFGGIQMLRQATVQLSSMNPAPYTVNRVHRHTVFTFDPGRPAFELVDADGRCWIMQTWSQIVDHTLSLDDLPGLGARLRLPAGWTYRVLELTAPLRVDTTTDSAQVIQDDLGNSYSLLTD